MIRIVATARKMDRSILEEAADFIEKAGYQVSFGKHLFEANNQFAGSDEMRASDFNEAIHDNEVKAILCARGGYGSVRILDAIDWKHLQKLPKWIVGYSDVTAIHQVCNYLSIASMHATMPINFKSNTQAALDSLFNTLSGASFTYEWDSMDLNRSGTCSGELVGGNLSMIYSMMGSTEQLNTTGKILFLEDLDEYLYHVDRMMMCLKRADLLSGLKGLIIGGMTDMNDNTIPFGKTVPQIILDAIKGYNFPVTFNAPFGHIDDNRTLVLGGQYKLQVKESKVYLSSSV